MTRVLTDRDTGDETLALYAPLDVLAWRYEQLEQAGYPVLVALELAENPGVDLHRACEMLGNGASVEDAVRILV
ncbi:MAG: hypothetical protein H0U59_04250 [Gemmatimonadaceae bacterium]|nr:hypothetical protein [Gemmatimonadaceae bacterium]